RRGGRPGQRVRLRPGEGPATPLPRPVPRLEMKGRLRFHGAGLESRSACAGAEPHLRRGSAGARVLPSGGMDQALRTPFDANAELYDAARPSYPEERVDEVVLRSGIPPGGRILEIGAGTGKATLSFARRGYAILALEPGGNMAAVLRRSVAGFP